MRLTPAVLGGIVLSAAIGGSAMAQDRTHIPLAPALNPISPQLFGNSHDAAIKRAFRSVLNRDPTSSELQRYRGLMDEYNWTEQDVQRDLRDRPDYQRYSSRRGVRPEAIVRRAYQDILGREPDAEGLRTYRSKIIDQGWSEQDVREALRRSPEYSSGGARTASADRIIRRAYQDILHREPDQSGLDTYRRNIVERGWEEQDVRTALRRSQEKREQPYLRQQQTIGDAEATDIVRRAYQSVLNRDPDDSGLRDYKARVLRDHWSEQQVMDALRNSDEYRSRHR